ncbi:hypothetical protein AVEN_26120-1, partial [Araneus ventricosus]
SFTHRVWALLWWAFCFFVLVSYVSALSAALLRNRSHVISTYAQKTTHELLGDLLQKGSPSIGVIYGGSSMNFFVVSFWKIHFQKFVVPELFPKISKKVVERKK